VSPPGSLAPPIWSPHSWRGCCSVIASTVIGGTGKPPRMERSKAGLRLEGDGVRSSVPRRSVAGMRAARGIWTLDASGVRVRRVGGTHLGRLRKMRHATLDTIEDRFSAMGGDAENLIAAIDALHRCLRLPPGALPPLSLAKAARRMPKRRTLVGTPTDTA
jgi:hypothetical protein